MDTITHILFGLLITLFFYYREKTSLAWAVFWCGAVASALPDFDVILRVFGQGLYLVEHRGFTHSILGAIIQALVISYAFSLKFGHRKKFFDVSLLVLASHILMDLPTPWGTMILWPFSYERFAWDFMFIVDPYLLFILIVGLVSYKLLKRHTVLVIALVAIVLHYAFLLHNHTIAVHRAEEFIEADEYHALPAFANPFQWNIYAADEDWYYLSRYDLLYKKFPPPAKLPRPPLTIMDEQREQVSDLHDFLRFARFPYYTNTTDTFAWQDLQFHGQQWLFVDVQQQSNGGFQGTFRSTREWSS